MEHSLLTLSLKSWLDLPLYSFEDWKRDQRGASPTVPGGPLSSPDGQRAAAIDIAQYYRHYVQKMNLSENFVGGVCVTSVSEAMPPTVPPTSPTNPLVGISSEIFHCSRCTCDRGVSCPLIISGTHEWVLKGQHLCNRSTGVVVRAKKLVLACGLTRPKRLCVPGEEQSYVIHTFNHFQSNLKLLRSSSKPIVVVGAGMSAGDAILLAIHNHIQVYHVFYQDLDHNFIFTKLPSRMYQEYHRVWNLMQGLEFSEYYTPFKQHRVKEFKEDGACVLTTSKGDSMTVSASAAIVMIGSQANIDFLPDHIKSTLAMELDQPIDSKHNCLDVDLYTSQSERFPNLYALGPLVGDHFVRFLFGSGLGCAKNILYQN